MATVGGVIYTKVFPQEAHSFDADAFDEAIRSQGVVFSHHRSMRCPVGMTEKGDARRPHEDHSGCHGGYLFTEAGLVTALFTGNSATERKEDYGILDGATVQVTIPRFYDPVDETSEPVRCFVTPYDRMYLTDDKIVVPTWELFESHITGVDRLSYPAVEVQDLVDADGIRYTQADFSIVNGDIVWTTPKRPRYNADINRGSICSVRYLYRPYYLVDRLLHEVRIARFEGSDGVRDLNRMPQGIVLVREFLAKRRDDEAAIKQQAESFVGPAARRASLGPR